MKEHQQTTIDQFTRQAVPFFAIARSHERRIAALLDRRGNLTEKDTVLDVACGTGIVRLRFCCDC
jgi:ubiquinone/menaquinone biosynthesis C-methylase UbiE